MEEDDPNIGRELSAPYRSARRNLVLVSAASIAWAAAQFSISASTTEILSIPIDFTTASIPVVLAFITIYLIARWGIEFAMMVRHIRRWRIAQLDFRIVSVVARFSILCISAGALQRSIEAVLIIPAILLLLGVVSAIFTVILVILIMPIRVWARSRAKRVSVANAAIEATMWAILLAALITGIGIILFGFSAYYFAPLSDVLWVVPPDPIAFSIFITTLLFIFLSHWLQRPLIDRLFAARPDYRTYRDEKGRVIYRFMSQPKEPIC